MVRQIPVRVVGPAVRVFLLMSFGAANASAQPPKISVHGYLTQGWGRSNGVAFYGLSDDASTDFRYAALQMRYVPTDNDQFVVQVNHRRLGRSPITDFESDVSLNWAFYQRAFREGTTVKIGRMPIPRGIYNELRSVGVVLPMYRPPVVFYDEGAYYSETDHRWRDRVSHIRRKLHMEPGGAWLSRWVEVARLQHVERGVLHPTRPR